MRPPVGLSGSARSQAPWEAELHAPYADLCARAQELLRAGKAGEAAATLSNAVKNGARDAEVLSLPWSGSSASWQHEHGGIGVAGRTGADAPQPGHPVQPCAHGRSLRSARPRPVVCGKKCLALRPDHAEARVGIQQLDNPTTTPWGRTAISQRAQNLELPRSPRHLPVATCILDEIYAHRKSVELGVGVDVLGKPIANVHLSSDLSISRQFDSSAPLRARNGEAGIQLFVWAERCRNVLSIET